MEASMIPEPRPWKKSTGVGSGIADPTGKQDVQVLVDVHRENVDDEGR